MLDSTKIIIFTKTQYMKPIICLFALFAISFTAYAQESNKEICIICDSLLKENKHFDAYKCYKEIKSGIDNKDSLYNYVTFYYIIALTQLENEARMKEDFLTSLKYGLEALKLTQDNKQYFFDEKFSAREQWMLKNIIVSNFGLGRIEEAKKYKDILYKGYKEGKLPNGIDEYFNFDFFRIDKKNIWGYEWYPELPENRFSGSFTKIVYYVYSTNEDGTDNEQLYRYHVLMYHHDSKDSKFDYLLERQQEIDNTTVSGSYYQFTYKKDIDYAKLKQDVTKIIKNEILPDTKRVIYNKK